MKKSQIYILLASLSLLGLFAFPIWRITLDAPQYPNGISMYIWINQITGDTEHTLQNINILNHYIGMKYIEPDSIPELTYFPYIIIGVIVLGIGLTFIQKRHLWLSWAMLIVVLGAAGIYDFYLWEYDYGHNLSSTAAIKVPGMVYQPPLIGSKMLLNFKASSYPHTGALFIIIAIGLAIIAWWKAGKEQNTSSNAQKLPVSRIGHAAILSALVFMSGCAVEPQAIRYGQDACVYCQMTIVDSRYGTEVVSKTGKAYKFDSVECLIDYMKDDEIADEDVGLLLITGFTQPQKLLPAQSSIYLHSKDLPSPMGMYLTAFETAAIAQEFQRKHEGTLYSWEELNTVFDELANRNTIKP